MSGLVPLEGKLYAVVYVLRAESTRIISLRTANKREAKRYEKYQ
ncbi:MAG: BrnT family toxin [Comamonadaceae bacterium]|nr:BrnT family toxin [Comamonadaceae bacterium]